MPCLPQLVAVLNLTPDSFSDGGATHDPTAIIQRVDTLIAQGAHIIDLGAESTRPGATALSADDEWQRLEPVLAPLIKRGHRAGVTLSLDTRHATNAARAIALGIDWINDVGGLHDPAMCDAVKDSPCTLVIMHALDIPADPSHTLPADCDPIAEITHWASQRIDTLAQQGIDASRLILDPGIGFGKTAQQSLALILRSHELHNLGIPILIGHSRKSFLSLFADHPAAQRDPLTRAFSALLAQQGIDYLRVHDIAGHCALWEQLA